MIYEVRTYTLKPGSVAEAEKRFGEALAAREKHSKLGAFWHTDVGPLNQIIHVWPYESLQHRTQVREAAAKEVGWPPKIQEFIETMESEIFIPAPFMRPLGNQTLGNVYEMRIYTYQPGAMSEVLKRWADSIVDREKLSPLAACWYSEIGGLNKFVHIWPYKDLEERARIRAESQKLPKWPPPTREFLMRQENKLLIPAAFSPMK
ncbi:MAG TPA: NIPSNAP family protein [Alphaproteobacteria bacterium]|nr:NIPSNAP family protein [Alphaproteobacteria bacterium]